MGRACCAHCTDEKCIHILIEKSEETKLLFSLGDLEYWMLLK
jgi:hypothetical protein